jgi:hypothetical protein
LGLNLNENGLFRTYAEAAKAAEYTMAENAGVEPISWMPWLVLEHDSSLS